MAKQKDIMDIETLFLNLGEAWNKGDGTLYGDCFTEDADYVTFMGQHLKGRKQISDVHQWLFDGPLKGSKMELGSTMELQPRFVTSDVAIVHGEGEVKLADPNHDSDERESINTNVVVKNRGEWKITAFHNCRIQEPSNNN
ncbi:MULTISPECIES: SgcJ/EcaC family oxidoreductase [Virgibacillus]|uniref:DUF4440 domain-containing protein n=2 Tax=Virgibacillus TaxID=84406 RepID=A0A024QE98_9BACI|nr:MULTISPECIES: SgcJ/EcaC family oxidoreductase [Virgibacillus]EQB35305.1 hypothetical protein M948_19590 [Virgibacillus sp. CM-4]MYL42666.1 SgcJ/EcaC family oxidoreductase [Virgibacillus massiliensis]GGJ75914.1 hypothetical protein GCM10007111_41790 [Virgibacillus kapii]CDQ40552.1 hypothetical protein BN990_02877 [Virgibacillus massiliensis]